MKLDPFPGVLSSIADEQSLVDDPNRARRVWFFMLAWTLGGIGAVLLVTASLDPAKVFAVPVAVFLSLYAARGGMVTMRRAQAYRHGWLDGRSAIIASLSEASRRGMDLDEWAQLEAERSARVMSH